MNSKKYQCCVYLIINKLQPNKMYIGYTTQLRYLKSGKIINKRFTQHRYDLKHNKHINKDMQQDYNNNNDIFMYINILWFKSKKKGKDTEKELIQSGQYFYNIIGNRKK